MDLTEEFVDDYIIPALQGWSQRTRTVSAGHLFRPPDHRQSVWQKSLIKEGADAICHGCTGKGNDQVRFELAISRIAPDMQIIAPWREWTIKSRDEEIDYAEAHNIPLKINRETNYSKDKNLWHLSHEGLIWRIPPTSRSTRKKASWRLGVVPCAGTRQAHLCDHRL
ncbi:MAG: argininosuccinate synthase domain-containing protein [Ruminococcus sp.]